MGDLNIWSAKSISGPIKLSTLQQCHYQRPARIEFGAWENAENVTHEIISSVKPTFQSDKRRKEIVEYIQKVIGDSIGCESISGPIKLSTLQQCDYQRPARIEFGAWENAENVTHEIISSVKPTFQSDKRRKEIVEYIQKVIGDSIGCEVYQFGSVPLNTYLPDGDIDLTVFGAVHLEDEIVNAIAEVLRGEEANKNAKFFVKDVQLIRAEVKLVKCLVQNIVVDISFNQLGGLATLCLLEHVDRVVQNRNMFKRSIMLIKAWCYHESRILGSHHGLISTYALETMILYIFHLFHASLRGPLQVLHKFLEYFSQFNWDKYCISLFGPVHISYLPAIVAERPDNGGARLMLSRGFLLESMMMFIVPSRICETQWPEFPPKYLNIFDPLKDYNNLGRSVSKGNFYRIISAFNLGYRKLTHILTGPQQNVPDQLHRFFSNIVGDKLGKDMRPDVYNPLPNESQKGSMIIETKVKKTVCSGYANELAPSMTISGVRRISDDYLSNSTVPLPSLTGDYSNHLKSLRLGWGWLEFEMSGRTLPMYPLLNAAFQEMYEAWIGNEIKWWAQNANDYARHPPFYHPMKESSIHGDAFDWEERQRGTGIYFPNTNIYNGRPVIRRGRNQGQGRYYRHYNGRNIVRPQQIKAPTETISVEESQEQFPVLKGREKAPLSPQPVLSDQNESPPVNATIAPTANGGAKVAEPLTEHVDQEAMEPKELYQLTDEHDFPPLSN